MLQSDKKNKQWGDEEEEEDFYETKPDAKGIKERIRITVNSKGQKVKTTTKIRVKEIKMRVPLRVLERRNLPKFGEAKDGEENVTLPSRDFIAMEHPDDQMADDAEDPTLAKTLANFITKQQERGMAREHNLDEIMEEQTEEKLAPEKSTGEKYVAPGSRGGGVSEAFKSDRDGSENTIRVSNLTKAVTEDDLRDLFERFGKIHRVSLPKIEREDGKKEPRGFAYIAFVRREDAERAMERLDGYGYDHLIIKLEWAKPNQGGGDSGGRQFMSGYGKQLVQDTTEKVYFASNLTGNK